jgi:hypothetical protein
MADTSQVAVLRIELEGIEPLIWRRVAVRSSITLMDVHRVVQAAMGWLDYHLWHFETDSRRFAMWIPREPDWNERYEDAGSVTLGALLDSGLRRFAYAYDMGDFWEHSVIVEKVSPPLPAVRYPQFLGGEQRCPPEDCGGVPGYYEFLADIESKQKAKRKSVLDWYGGPYNADDIGASEIAASFSRIGPRLKR